MIRTYVEVDENNVALGAVSVHGPLDAPDSMILIPHDNPQDVEVGSLWNGTEWVNTAELVRSKRDTALEDVDVMAGNVLRWNSLSDTQRESWTQYRIDLLNVPQQAGFPLTVVWPTKP